MSGPKLELELKLNLSPPRGNRGGRVNDHSPSRSRTTTPPSPHSSCVSLEPNQDGYSSSPEPTTSMMLVGCPRCLMYVILADLDPRCPKCKSTVLLDFVHDDSTTTAGTTMDSRNSKKG